jgi:hypothetical protein
MIILGFFLLSGHYIHDANNFQKNGEGKEESRPEKSSIIIRIFINFVDYQAKKTYGSTVKIPIISSLRI